MYIHVNPNPLGNNNGDCVARALSQLLHTDWMSIYMALCVQGAKQCDWGCSNAVWGEYLKSKGYKRDFIPDDLPIGYTIKDFCRDNVCSEGIVCTGANGGSHVVYVKDGNYLDSWDSGDEIVLYFWHRKEDEPK